MFAMVAILFVMTWGVALFAFHVAGFSIPVVPVFAAALFVGNLATGPNRSA